MQEPFLQNQIPKRSKIILAVSGGPDSVYLLMQCLELRKTLPFSLLVAHVNHGLRGKESDGDEQFVRKLCQKYDLPFYSHRANLMKKRGNIEELGRMARYQFFEQLRQKHQAKWILTGHHLNDNVETALFNLIRGSSCSGIKGMSEKDPLRHIMRPLLNVSRQEILHFLEKHAIDYRLDPSNQDLKYSRNLLRIKVIPLLKKINTNFEQTFASNLENFTEMAGYFEKRSETWLKKNQIKEFPHPAYPLTRFQKEPVFFQKTLLAALYKKTYGSTQGLSQVQIQEILKVFSRQKNNLQKEFGSSFRIKLARDASRQLVFFIEPGRLGQPRIRL